MATIYTPAQVNAWYQAVQFRDGPQATVASYVSLLNSSAITPSQVQSAIIGESFTAVNVNPVIRLYQAAFNRVPDQVGQNAWVDQLAATPDAQKPAAIQQIAVGFANSQEFIAEYGANASSPINAAVLTAFYANVLNRGPDTAGFNAWLNSGQTVGQVLNGFAQSLEFIGASNNSTVLFQQAEIAGTAPNGVGSLFQFGGFPPSTTEVLTTNIDTIDISLGNTLITGTQSTFQANDTINGGTTIGNTLNLTDTGTAAWTVPAATVSGVQTVNLQNINGVGGVTENGTITFQNVGVGGTLNIAGRVMTATGGTASAADIASAFASGSTVGNAAISGSLTGWTLALGGGANSIAFTSTTANQNVTNISVSGTAQSGQPQISSLIPSAVPGATTTFFTVTINGVAVNTAQVGTDSIAAANSVIANAINGYVGSSVASTVSTASVANVTTTSGSRTLTGTGIGTSLVVGQGVSGTGIPSNATVVAINSANSVTISAAATASSGGTPITLTGLANVIVSSPTALNLVATPSAGSSVVTNTLTQSVITAASASVATTQGQAAQQFTDTINAANFVGATSINSNNSTGAVVVANLANGQAAGAIGNGVATNGALTAGYGASATAATVNVSGGWNTGAISVTGSGLTSTTVNSSTVTNTIGGLGLTTAGATLNINANSALVTGGISNGSLETINVAGGAGNVAPTAVTGVGIVAVDLGTLGGSVTTVDASGLTNGGVNVVLDTAVTSFKGGQGSDIVGTAAVASTASIDAGAGVDTLVVSAATDVDTAAKAGVYKGFEVIRLSASQDMSLFTGTSSTLTAIQMDESSTAAISNLTAAQSQNITVRGNQATSFTLGLANISGSADSIGLTLSNPLATAAVPVEVVVDGLSIAGVETLNVTSLGGATDLASVHLNKITLGSSGAINALSTIVVGGTSSLEMVLNNSGKAITLTSAQSGSGALKVSGNLLKGSSVTTTNLADIVTTTAAITGGTGDFVTYNTLAGNDTITSTIGAINNTSGSNGSLKIDGGFGTDTLDLSPASAALVTVVDANFQYLTNLETIVLNTGSKAISFTGAAFFNSNFAGNATTTLNLGSATNDEANVVDLTGFTGNVALNLLANAATSADQNVTSGSGGDTIAVNVAALTTGDLNLNAGAGNDNVTVTSSATALTTGELNLTGGLGADTFGIVNNPTGADANNVKYVVAAGDSLVGSNDILQSYTLSDGTDAGNIIDLSGTPTIAANVSSQSVSGYTPAQLTYSITDGLMTFAGTSAASLTAAQKTSIVQSVITTGLDSVVFTQLNGDGSTDSWVFNNNSAGDTLIQLVGIDAAGVGVGSTSTDFVNLG